MQGQYAPTLPIISLHSDDGSLQFIADTIQPAPASTTVTSVSNEARYYPLRISAPFLIVKFWWINGSAVSGNLDVGIYSVGGTKLVSTGSTAQSGTTATQSVALGTPYLLMPDTYYFAWCANNTTATMLSTTFTNGNLDGRRTGMFTQTTAFPLPATTTVASASGQSGKLPVMGISNRSTV